MPLLLNTTENTTAFVYFIQSAPAYRNTLSSLTFRTGSP
jgi:hypothetical protein